MPSEQFQTAFVCVCLYRFACQGESVGFGNFQIDHLVDHVGCTGKVDYAVVGGTGLQLVRVFFGDAFNQAALNRADHGLVDVRGFGFDVFV